MYGHLKYACVTNLGVVVVCKKGIYYHNIPTTLEMAMKSLYFWPDKVVFTDAGTYLITNAAASSATFGRESITCQAFQEAFDISILNTPIIL